ncbi:SRPBCC family protein [Halorubrum sp. DTA98]|uniref:SRPBCC family protein n=1 Tax=Halorubrum sp. DTA98 TaxID=3402163 RepID=UPI003AAD0024
MREVVVERFVSESPAVIERALSPARIVEWEGSFSVANVEPGDDETLVTVSGPGVGFRLRFERLPDGYRYVVADGDDPAGPFDRMETRLSVEPENEGSRVRLRSEVSLNAPLPFADRLAAWKRRGELDRALDGIDDAV